MPIYEEFCKKQRFLNEKCRLTRVQNAMVRKSTKFFFQKAIDKTGFVVYNSVSENANRLTC